MGASPLALATLVTAGAAATFLVVGLVRGGPHLGFDAGGWGWIGAIALVSTVTAIVTFFGGLARVGPSTASILSTFEPVVTVSLAAAAFGETLAPVQVTGGALVLGAVVMLQVRRRPRAAAARAAFAEQAR